MRCAEHIRWGDHIIDMVGNTEKVTKPDMLLVTLSASQKRTNATI